MSWSSAEPTTPGSTGAPKTPFCLPFSSMPYTTTERRSDVEGHAIKRVAVIGCGTIGASWTALFMAHGYDVTANELRPEAEAELRTAVAGLLPALQPKGAIGKLAFTTDLEACC